MSRKFRRFYETAFDSKISKSDEDLLSADKQDAAIARRMSSQLQLSASASCVRGLRRDDGCGPAAAPRAPSSSGTPSKNRLFGFLRQLQLQQKRRKYLNSDLSAATSSSVSLESITSDSLSSHSSESPCYRPRFLEPHVLSPISDKSLLHDAGGADVSPQDRLLEREGQFTTTAATTATGGRAMRTRKPPQSLGVVKLYGDHRQHHGSDSGISVGSKPGDSYQELSDVPFDMPKLRRKQRSVDVWCGAEKPAATSSGDRQPPLPFDMPKLRRKQLTAEPDAADVTVLPFDMPKLRRRQMDGRGGGQRVASLDLDFGFGSATKICADGGDSAIDRSDGKRGLPFDGASKRPDRSSLFLSVTSSSCAAVASDTDSKPQLKTFQNKSKRVLSVRRNRFSQRVIFKLWYTPLTAELVAKSVTDNN